MRIAINCRSFLQRQYAGIGRYAYNLVQSLGRIDTKNEYALYVRRKPFEFKRRVPHPPAKNFSVKVDWRNAGLFKTFGPVEIYHSPSPDSLEIDNTKIIVTVHDLIYKTYPQGHTPETIAQTERQLNEAVAKASKIICTSQSTLNDLHKYFSVEKSRTCTAYQGVDKDVFYPLKSEEKDAALRILKKKGITQPFILFVGTIEPRKNIANLLEAFHHLRSRAKFSGQLVCVGMKGWMSDGLSALIERLELQQHVIFPGYLTDQELRCFYGLTQVFVFPSFYEGFGFPIVEAFSCGAAVVASSTSSCGEIAGDAALLINPKRSDEIASAIERILQDENLKGQLQAKALRRAEDFSFQKTAQETLKVYKEVAGVA